MNMKRKRMPKVIKFWLLLVGGISVSACAGMFDFGGESWKEEVLQHDGSMIIVTRTQRYGGRHELGQEPPVSDEQISFSVPGEKKSITWDAKYSERAGRAELSILALYVVRGEAYVVAAIPSCIEYGRRGRPNPPYVLFKNTNSDWKVISINMLPEEIKEPSLVISTYGSGDIERAKKAGLISSERIKVLNRGSMAQEHKKIYHVPIDLQGVCRF